MQVALRLASFFLIAVALILLGADAVTSLDKGGEITVRSIEQVWAVLSPGSILSFKAWMEHAMPAGAHGVETVLTLPGWGITGVLGVLLNFLFGRRAAEAH